MRTRVPPRGEMVEVAKGLVTRHFHPRQLTFSVGGSPHCISVFAKGTGRLLMTVYTPYGNEAGEWTVTEYEGTTLLQARARATGRTLEECLDLVLTEAVLKS